ncbi:hypothetical protein GCM10028781_28520 [Nostocoides australiense]
MASTIKDPVPMLTVKKSATIDATSLERNVQLRGEVSDGIRLTLRA